MRTIVPSCILRGCCLVALLVGGRTSSLNAQGGIANGVAGKDGDIEQRLRAYELENIALREQLENERKSLSAWGDNAAEANAEAEVFRRQYESLKLRVEALGLSSVATSQEALEQRLLKSVCDLALARRQTTLLSDQLLALSESVLRYLKTTGDGDPQLRVNVEVELRAVNEALGTAAKSVNEVDAVPANLRSGAVLGCKESLSLLVANLGSKHGVRVGMPLTVARGDTFVGRARVVQVRERISGALIEEMSSNNNVRVGDQIRVEALN